VFIAASGRCLKDSHLKAYLALACLEETKLIENILRSSLALADKFTAYIREKHYGFLS
jgi:hypothetical protein